MCESSFFFGCLKVTNYRLAIYAQTSEARNKVVLLGETSRS